MSDMLAEEEDTAEVSRRLCKDWKECVDSVMVALNTDVVDGGTWHDSGM